MSILPDAEADAIIPLSTTLTLPTPTIASLEKAKETSHNTFISTGTSSSSSSTINYNSSSSDTILATRSYPWSIKGPILLLVLTLTLNLAPNWIADSLPALKSIIESELDINNAQYGDIASAASLINTFFPFISGVLIDWYGAELLSILSSSALLVGTIIAGIGASTTSYPTLLIGEIIVGFGSAQTKIYTHYFYGNHLGFIYGLNLATGRIINVIAQSTAVPIVNDTGYWSWSIWVPALVALLALGFNTVYVFYQRTLPIEIRSLSGREIAMARLVELERLDDEISTATSTSNEEGNEVYGKGERAGKKVVKKMPDWKEAFKVATLIPAAFWFITLTQVLQIGVTQTYLNLTANMIQVTRNETNLLAGYTAAVQQVSSIFLTPCVGALFDKYGRRMYYVSFGASLWIIVFVTMGFTQVNAFVPVIITSLALSINLMPFLATVPILVPDERLIGTAFGVWKCYENTGHVIISVTAGAIQDLTPTGTNSYSNVFYMLIAIKSIDVILGIFYHKIDVKYLGSVLRMSEKEKIESDRLSRLKMEKVEKEIDENVVVGGGGKGKSMNEARIIWTWAGLGGGTVMMLIAWIIYLIFAK